MNIKYVIPSCGRANKLNEKTLLTLHQLGVEPDNIYVFVVADEEEHYRKTLIKSWHGHIIVGVKGIAQQRNFIQDFFNEGDFIVSLDDDIEDIDLSLTHWTSFSRFIEDSFILCLDKKCSLWGVYPTYNKFFREKRTGVKYGLNFCIGHMFGFVNHKDLKRNIDFWEKEDYHFTLLNYLRDGIVIRFDRVAARTKYMANAGGIGKRRDREAIASEHSKLIHAAYPDYTKLKQRKNGLFEVVLYDGKLKKPVKQTKAQGQSGAPPSEPNMLSVSNIARSEPVWLDPVSPEELQPLFEALEKIKIPYQSGTSGRAATFNKHRACTMGLIKPRGKKDFTLTAATKKWPEIAKMIYDLGKRICKVPFTSIHINESVCCPPHFDPVNSRDSTIISFGNYEGLKLVIEDLGEFDTWCHPLQFNGAQHKHWNTALESGKKYSLVYFFHSNPQNIDSDNGLGELINQQLAVKNNI